MDIVRVVLYLQCISVLEVCDISVFRVGNVSFRNPLTQEKHGIRRKYGITQKDRFAESPSLPIKKS